MVAVVADVRGNGDDEIDGVVVVGVAEWNRPWSKMHWHLTKKKKRKSIRASESNLNLRIGWIFIILIIQIII